MRRFLVTAVLILLLGASGIAMGAPRTTALQTDLFFGDGGAGPYSLTWTAVRPASEAVYIDGRRAVGGLDYTLDYAAGTVRFHAPVERGQVVQVEYQYDDRRAKPNRTALQSPFALTVLERGRSNVRMLGAFRRTDGGLAPGLLGFSAETRVGGASLQSHYLTNPVVPNAPGARGAAPAPDWGETSALRLAAEGRGRGLSYRAHWAQAGGQFAGAPQLQTPSGLRRVELAAAYQPTKTVSFEARSEQIDALDSAKRREERSLERLALSYRPSAATALTLSQEATGKAKPDGGEEEVRQSRIQLDQKWGVRAQATALFERAERHGTAQDDRRDRMALLLQTRLWEPLSLTTRAEQTASQRDGDGHVYGVGAELKGPANLTLGGGWTLVQTERTGARTDTQLRLALRGPVTAGAELQRRDSEREGESSTSVYHLAAGAKGWLKLQAREHESVTPGGLTRSESAYRIEAKPHAAVKLAAQTATREVGEQPAARDQEAVLELSPSKAVSLGGGLKTSTQGDATAAVTSVTGGLRTSLLDVEGQFRERERHDADDVTTRDLQLALKPADWLKLTGRYTQNPEDRDGRVQEEVARSLGVQTRVGALTLGGVVCTVEGRGGRYEKQQLELNLGLKFSPYTDFYSAFRASDEQAAIDAQARTYRLGFRHSVGSQFYLKLEGEHTTYEQNGVRLSDREDTRANFGLGLRF